MEYLTEALCIAESECAWYSEAKGESDGGVCYNPSLYIDEEKAADDSDRCAAYASETDCTGADCEWWSEGSVEVCYDGSLYDDSDKVDDQDGEEGSEEGDGGGSIGGCAAYTSETDCTGAGCEWWSDGLLCYESSGKADLDGGWDLENGWVDGVLGSWTEVTLQFGGATRSYHVYALPESALNTGTHTGIMVFLHGAGMSDAFPTGDGLGLS